MAIQVKRDQLERQGAAIHPGRVPFKANLVKPEPPPDALAIKISDLMAASNVQSVEHLQAMKAIGYQISVALSSLKRPEGWTGNWDVHIKRRDALGRISEVQFKPSKA